MSGFPFVAVAAMEEVKLALMLGAVEPRLGGVLLRGEKGSAKTTLARGLADLLPGAPPFVELPLGATEDRVVGTIDLASALRDGERRFRPGLLQAADKGLLYVDEVNLLADHIVDVLLDVAVSGTNRVEREGLSWEHPARFFLVGSMNPEEGELRPQLLDRFGLSVEVKAPMDPVVRAEAVRRRLEFDDDPEDFVARWAEATRALRERLCSVQIAAIPDEVLDAATTLAAGVGADGLRADLSLCRAAASLAGLEGRTKASIEDLRVVAPMCLSHRRRRGPFDDHGLTEDEIDEALGARHKQSEPPSNDQELAPEGAATEQPSATGHGHGQGGGDRSVEPSAKPPAPPQAGAGQRDHEQRAMAELPHFSRPVARHGGDGPVQEGRTPSSRSSGAQVRGRMLRTRPADPVSPGPIAVSATALAAGARRIASGGSPEPVSGDHSALLLEPGDLQESVTEERHARLVVLCVDTSGSMGATKRVAAARAAVLRLLTDAYQRRDRVAVVSFCGDSAEVLLRPTGSIEVARRRLDQVPTGGRTPLAAGILAGLELCSSPSASGLSPVLVIVTDGRATSGETPREKALEAARMVQQARIPALVVDVESSAVPLGLGAVLAQAMGARHLPIEISDERKEAERINGAVRSLLE